MNKCKRLSDKLANTKISKYNHWVSDYGLLMKALNILFLKFQSSMGRWRDRWLNFSISLQRKYDTGSTKKNMLFQYQDFSNKRYINKVSTPKKTWNNFFLMLKSLSAHAMPSYIQKYCKLMVICICMVHVHRHNYWTMGLKIYKQNSVEAIKM